MGIDLYKLDHLVAVSEEGSFTRAAARLHLSQQALSTSIRTLERQVGVELLTRGSAGVRLLPAGESLVADARVLHGVVGSALRRARRIGRGEPEVLRIGHTPAVTGDEVTSLVHRAQESHPGLSTQVNQRYPDELTRALTTGDLDIGLCRAMAPADGLASTVLLHQPLHVAVAQGHPLAERESVALSELANEDIVVWGAPGSSGYTDLLVALCRDAGFEPRVRRNPIQGTPPTTAVLDGAGVAFVTAEPGPTASGRVRVVRLTPPVETPLQALWPEHAVSEARAAFLAAFD